MKSLALKHVGSLLLLSLIPALLSAAESGERAVEFDGFGTLGLVWTDLEQADFTASSLKPGSAGYTRSVSGDVDSLLGGQMSVQFSERLSGIVQVIAEKNPGDDYAPHVEWLNLQYEISPGFSLSLGRTVIPSFLVSNYRKVGIATPWLRPPVELYDMVPITTSDGIGARLQTSLGEAFSVLELTYGVNDSEVASGTDLKIRDGWGITETLEFGAWTLHGSIHGATINISSFTPLFDGFRGFGAVGQAIAETYDPNGEQYYYFGLAASYDPGDWFVLGELGHAQSDSILNERYAAYLTAGIRAGSLTPYLTLATTSEAQHEPPLLDTGGLPPALAATAQALNTNLRDSARDRPNQTTGSLGLRWTLNSRAALVFEYSHTDLGADSSGTLINEQPGFEPGGSFNLFSAAVHFLFP